MYIDGGETSFAPPEAKYVELITRGQPELKVVAAALRLSAEDWINRKLGPNIGAGMPEGVRFPHRFIAAINAWRTAGANTADSIRLQIDEEYLAILGVYVAATLRGDQAEAAEFEALLIINEAEFPADGSAIGDEDTEEQGYSAWVNYQGELAHRKASIEIGEHILDVLDGYFETPPA